MTTAIECLLLLGLIITALAAPLQRRPMNMVILYSAFGVIMSALWMLLRAPDLAITEAAVGTGVTGVLFYLTLRKVHQLKGNNDE